MAAAGLVSASKLTNGLRPVRLRRDLASIADLIECCFAPTLDAAGRSAILEMRMLSRTGPLLWVLGRLSAILPGLMQGFVWIEDGRLVGNVSIALAGYGKGRVIANVAVHPDYRRQGIARRLMQAALDTVARQGAFAILQVEADNLPARALYEGLGFHEQRVFTRWRRAPYPYTSILLPPTLPTRRITRHEGQQLDALAQRVRPEDRGGMGWLRPTKPGSLHPSLWHKLVSLLGGYHQNCWVVPGQGRELEAAVITETRLPGTVTIFDLLVRPERQEQLEAPLLHDMIRRLGGQYQPLVTEHPADDRIAEQAFRENHFTAERTLVHMIWHTPQLEERNAGNHP